tara:strand:- start:375 stop:1067 length:693 start_codon:yes stop_codon:yes gene_type:complete
LKSNIPDKVVETLKEIGMTHQEAGWNCHGTYVLLHKALEKVGVAKKIKFDAPQILENDSSKRVVSLMVMGHMGDKSEWSIGEASPSNNKNSYPYAMAEKRAKDRVILKLVGLHGDVYAEDEADSFKEERPKEIKGGTVETEDKDDLPEVTFKKLDNTEETVKGIEFIKEVFITFLPIQHNRADIVGFWKNNKEARETLKELSLKDYEEVETAFKKRAEEIVNNKGENDGK